MCTTIRTLPVPAAITKSIANATIVEIPTAAGETARVARTELTSKQMMSGWSCGEPTIENLVYRPNFRQRKCQETKEISAPCATLFVTILSFQILSKAFASQHLREFETRLVSS